MFLQSNFNFLNRPVLMPHFINKYITRKALRLNSVYYPGEDFDFKSYNILDEKTRVGDMIGTHHTFQIDGISSSYTYQNDDDDDNRFDQCMEKYVSSYVFHGMSKNRVFGLRVDNPNWVGEKKLVAAVDISKYVQYGAEMHTRICGNLVYLVFLTGTGIFIFKKYQERDTLIDLVGWGLFYYICRFSYPVGFASDPANFFCVLALPPLYIESLKDAVILGKNEVQRNMVVLTFLLSPLFYHGLRQDFSRRSSLFYLSFFIFHTSFVSLLCNNKK